MKKRRKAKARAAAAGKSSTSELTQEEARRKELRRYFDLSSDPSADSSGGAREERFRVFEQNALMQREARERVEWAVANPEINRPLRKILGEFNSNNDDGVLQHLAELLIEQIVYCQQSDQRRSRPLAKLRNFQHQAKHALSLVEPLEKRLLRLEIELKESVWSGLREDLERSIWGERLSAGGNSELPFGLGLKPEDKLEDSLSLAVRVLREVRALLSVPGISPVQGAGKQHDRLALFGMAAASFHLLTHKKPAGIATDPSDGSPTGQLWEFCAKLSRLVWPDQKPPISIIKKAAATFRDDHRGAESLSCEFCNPRDLPT